MIDMSDQLQQNQHRIMDVCLLAGKIMLQSGAETYRVEDTMVRIASAYGYELSHSYVTPTGIIFSVDGDVMTRFIRISNRSTDLTKVAMVNHISRQISDGKYHVIEAHDKLRDIEKGQHTYAVWLQLLAAALASGCFLIMYQGLWQDVVPAMIAGGLGFSGLLYIHRLVQIRFFAEFIASLIIGLVAYLLVLTGLGHQLDKIIIGSVMPLVPGVLITNAVRDLMAGHLVSGLSKGAEAFLTAFAIGAGVAFVLAL